MNEKRKIPLVEIILAILAISGLIFLVVKSLISAKATEKKPEIEPTDAGTENNLKPTVVQATLGRHSTRRVIIIGLRLHYQPMELN